MDFNARISQQFRNPNSNGNNNNGRSRKKDDDSDAFMRLPDREIAGCISDIGVPFSPADLQKPNPQQIQLVFEWFAELLMNTTRETVEPAMRAAAEDICGEYMDIVPSDTRNLMGFYISLRKLLSEVFHLSQDQRREFDMLMAQCGIHDFSFSDLIKPTHERLVKIFSYIINFVRFRESQTATIDEHFNKSERTKARIETLYAENQDMEQHLDETRRSRKSLESQVKDKSRRNEELKQRLLELKKGQEKVVERLESVRAEKSRRTRVLEEKTERSLTVRQECEKLRPYVLQSPAALQASLGDLSDALSRDKAQIDALDRRTRALQTSTDTFTVVASDVAACTKLLTDLAAELAREEDEALKAARHRDALAERGNNVREVERTEALLARQLARWTERTEALRLGSREKTAGATAKMEALRGVHRRLTDERAEKGREMDRRRVRIEQTEKKMVDLKENIEAEIAAAREEYLCMEAHVRLYVTEMEGAL